MNISHNLAYARYRKGMKVHDPMPNVTYKDMKKIIGLTPAMSMGDSSGQIDSLQTRANSGGIDFAFDNTKRTIIEEEEPPTDPRVLSEFEQNGTSSPDFQSDNPFLGGGIDGGDGEEVIEESTGGPGCKACCDSGGSEDIQLCGWRPDDPQCAGCPSAGTCVSSQNPRGCCPIPDPCVGHQCPAGCVCEAQSIGDNCDGGTPVCTDCPDFCDQCPGGCGCDANGFCIPLGDCGCGQGDPVECTPEKPCGGGCPPDNGCEPDPGCGCGNPVCSPCDCGDPCGNCDLCDKKPCPNGCGEECNTADCPEKDCLGVCDGGGCDGQILCCPTTPGGTRCEPCPPCPDTSEIVITGVNSHHSRETTEEKILSPLPTSITI